MKRAIATVALILSVCAGFAQSRNGTPMPEDNREAIRIAAEKEAERILAEKEAARLAAEKARAEKEARKAAIKAEREAVRVATEQKREREREKRATQQAVNKEVKRIVAEREAARIAAEKDAVAKAEAERKAQEQARITAEKEAVAKAKAEEQARIAAEREAAAKAKAEEQARITAEKKAERKERIELFRKENEASKRFGSMLEVSSLAVSNHHHTSVGLTYIAGYHFNKYLYVGGGAGINFNLDAGSSMRLTSNQYSSSYLNPCLVSIPVFAYFRANILDRRISPFFALAAGGNISGKQTLHLTLCSDKYNTSGVFFNPQLGVNFRAATKVDLYLAVGFNGYTTPSCPSYTAYSAIVQPKFACGLDIHFGISF